MTVQEGYEREERSNDSAAGGMRGRRGAMTVQEGYEREEI